MDPEIAAWRRQQRTALLAKRETLSPEDRQRAAQYVAERLSRHVAACGCSSIGLYWPIKHEINLLPWAERTGLVLCLPVVIKRNAPLEYWRWKQGEPLGRGFWDIPVPASRDVVVPDLMLAPMVGFDQANYRLGYGGGYFDRTLAALTPRPTVIGIGYDFSALDSIFPLSHDIPMDVVVTEYRDTLRENRSDHADRC
jgi:5-formyltetrahydrofolate cyclo-ligase